MKTLLLLRHAKSSWANPDQDDHDRPLNKRGLGDAPRAGEWLAGQDLLPDRIYASSALRAQTTAELAADACAIRDRVTVEPRLYLAEPEDYFAVIAALPPELNRVMLVAHNPGIEDFQAMLTGQNMAMPTAALAHVELPILQWADLTPGLRGSLAAFWLPKDARD